MRRIARPVSAHVIVGSLGILGIVGGCSKPATTSLTDEEIIGELNARIGAQACCFYAGKNGNGENIYGPLDAHREIHLIIRRSLDAENVACGLSGFPKARAFNGTQMPSADDTVFVVRNKHLLLEKDMMPDEFERLQDQLCGPDWVRPLLLPAPSFR